MIKIDFNNLNCENCPAINHCDLNRIKKIEEIRSQIIDEVHFVEIILLGESTPAGRFIYDLKSDYSSNGLRYNLRMELVNGGRDDQLLNYLKKRGIIIVDCAFCPLHRLNSNTDRRDAATKCLSRHTFKYLDAFPEAKIITFFPNNLGFKKTELPNIASRVKNSFQFSKLNGLKKEIAIIRVESRFEKLLKLCKDQGSISDYQYVNELLIKFRNKTLQEFEIIKLNEIFNLYGISIEYLFGKY